MDKISNTPAQDKLPFQAANLNQEDVRLKEACEEFEAMLLSQLLKAMRATTFKSDLFGNSQENEIYNSMLNDAIAKNMAKQDGIGLAAILYQQLKGEHNR